VGGHGVEALWRDESARYDVGRDEFLAVAWGDWLEAPPGSLR
jgi:hypothetical protein